MNRKLNAAEIESVCRGLMAANGRVTFRGLRAELVKRLGAAGRSERVLAVWRRLGAGAGDGRGSAAVETWQARAESAEARATLAEERERTHQDRWANEIHALREQLHKARAAAHVPARIYDEHRQALQEVQKLRCELADQKGGG